jgi:predicted DsbA family dithiol-disulfide isomerase
VKIEVWSDVVCPWCYVGSRHLAAALRSFPHADEVQVEWRSYELDPRAPAERPGTYVERISRKYGLPVGEARARMSRIVQIGADAGIDFRFDDARLGNTFDAHRLLHLAKAKELQGEVKERLFAAAFTEGRPIGDHETLVTLAVDAGVREVDARRVLESDEHAVDVRADEAEARDLGVDGVPFFLLGRRAMIPGAQSPETMLAILERAWHKLHAVDDRPAG